MSYRIQSITKFPVIVDGEAMNAPLPWNNDAKIFCLTAAALAVPGKQVTLYHNRQSAQADLIAEGMADIAEVVRDGRVYPGVNGAGEEVEK